MKISVHSIRLSDFTQTLFPMEVAPFYYPGIGLRSLIEKIRTVNESMAFDIWRYLLVRAPKRLDTNCLIESYDFSFEPEFESLYLNALVHDENFREAMFKQAARIDKRQAFLLFLTLKYEETDLFDDCMRRFRRNATRFRRRTSYTLDKLLLCLIDLLRGRVGASYFSREIYGKIYYYAEIIALPHRRKAVIFEAKEVLRFYEEQLLTSDEKQERVLQRTMHMVLKTEERRIRERDVKHPIWNGNRTIIPYAIAGLYHYLSQEQIEELLPLGTKLVPAYEQDNKFDSVAVSLSMSDGQKVGYIGKPYNRAFCEMLQDGRELYAEVTEVEKDIVGVTTVWVTIFIVT